ncbi:MAG: hypothetical protein DMG88_18510 [Acidobacteria bacterium]|nr:MAG: hypothetical protein DMG88_18510 [Acidobacteriota bacterium]
MFGFRNNSEKFQADHPPRVKISLIPMNGAEHHTSPEKRRYPRYEIDTELHVTILGLEQPSTMRGRSLNIGEAGIAGVFVTVWGIGVPVHLEFTVPVMSSPVRVRGIVRSQSGYRYGFEFVDLNPAQREVISKTCRTLALLE